MERMDEILAKWMSKPEVFPEELRAREETSCCSSPILVTATGPHDPPA